MGKWLDRLFGYTPVVVVTDGDWQPHIRLGPSEDATRFSIQEHYNRWQTVGLLEVMIRGTDPVGLIWVREASQAGETGGREEEVEDV